MLNNVKQLLAKYRDVIAYIIVGSLATLINAVSYFVLFKTLKSSNVASTAIAWMVAVLFAFVANKIFVFRSQCWSPKLIAREVGIFFGFRAVTGILDLCFMWLTVDILLWNGILMKIISNTIITIINYFASKLYIFKKEKAQKYAR